MNITERRVNHRMREIFVSACQFLAPVVAGNDQVKTVSNFAMTHMLTDRFPDLSPAEIHVVIETVHKVHNSDRIRSILNR